MGSDDPRLASHAAALFGAISLVIAASGCGRKPTADANAIVPEASASAPAPSSAPAPVPEPVPTLAPSASAPAMETELPPLPQTSATAAPKRPPPRRPPPVKRMVIEGRPFLVDDDARIAAPVPGPGWSEPVDLRDAALDPGQREVLVQHYTRWALAEHASIASFARFALQLLALGAPADLVSRATSAMDDETRHARLGFGLVEALSGAPVRPGALRVEGALDAETTLEGALRTTVREGVVGETLAALEASLAADQTSLPWLKERLVRLAAEESRHAELAFAFAAWVVSRDPALLRVVREEVDQWQPPPLDAAAGLEGWGVLDVPARRRVHREGLRSVILPLVEQLAGRPDHDRAPLLVSA